MPAAIPRPTAAPLADFKQTIYLAPALFLSIASAFHSLTNLLHSRIRLPWLPPTTATLLFTLTAIYGIQTIQQNNPYRDISETNAVMSALKEQPQENEIVYVSAVMTPTIKFYQYQLPDADYHYCLEHSNFGACQQNILLQTNFSPTGRTYLLGRPEELQTLKPFDRRFQVTPTESEDITLLLLKGRAITQEQWQAKLNAANTPIIRGNFNAHIANNELLYIKDPCQPSDIIPRFSLHLYPNDPNDLPPIANSTASTT